MDKETLKKYLLEGKNSIDIAEITGIDRNKILKLIKKYDLNCYNQYNRINYKDVNYFNKIDTKEKAYIIGFLLGDGTISKNGHMLLSVQLSDIEILEFIQQELGCSVRTYNKYNKKQKLFPNAKIHIGNRTLCRDIKKLFGGRLKDERHIPIIKKELEPYLLQGFFDADGCITWGIRKDRDRIRQKVSFTSQYKLLEGIQNILIKNNISTKIRPKSKEKCYVMEICSKKEVLKILDLIYSDKDFVILKRKYIKSNALRLELEEFGGTTKEVQSRAELTE